MSKRQTLMALGVWVIILPFLGFPGFWERILMLATGIIIVGIAYTMRPIVKPASSSSIPYVEHKNKAVVPPVAPPEQASSASVPAPEIPPTTPVNS